MLSHFNFGTAMNIIYKHLDEQIMTQLDPTWKWENESFLILGNMYHLWTFNTLNTLVLSGTKAIIMKQFDPAVFCRSIDKYKIRILMLSPSILLFIAKDPIVDKYDLSSLELVITGGARVGKDLIEEVYKRLPNVKYIVQGYGSAETSSAYLPILNNIQHASIGKLVSNLEQKIIDLETGNELPIGQIGEICIKSPSNMMGYFNNPMATEECLDPENWYKTGDIGYLDEEGFMYFVDRKKELITVSGFPVAPAELEDVLLSKSDVRDCAVIGVPDGIIGEVPKAFVVKKNPNLTEQQVIEYVKEKLSPYKWLQGGVEFVQEIPKAPSGKILRRILRDRERNKSMLDVLRV